MSLISRYSKPVATLLPSICWWYCAWLKRYSLNPSKYPLEKRYKKLRNAYIRIQKQLNVNIYCEGLENVPTDANVCFVGNHLSDLDPLTISSLLEKPMGYVGKYEILNVPIIPTAMKMMESAFIKRNDLKQTLKEMRKVQTQMEEVRKNWLIFPEGTRNKDPLKRMIDFHPGTFRTPMKAGVIIVPFVLAGTNRVFKTKPSYKRYPVHVKFLKPITPKDYEGHTTDEIAKYCSEEVQRVLTFELRKKNHLKMVELNGDRYKFI